MRGTARIVGVAAVLLLGSLHVAEGQSTRGGPPRPAERPPEYGCRFLDLATIPNVVEDGGRIGTFLLKYECKEKTRPIDIEIRNERTPGDEPELVKVASDVVLERGEHTLRLGGGGLARGGRYITALKSGAPGGSKEVTRRVDTARCKGWRISYVERVWLVGGADASFRTDPDVFKTGERIDKFILTTNLKHALKSKDIKISWQPRTGERSEARREVVKVATDVNIPAGRYTMNLVGGGVGKEGYYILEIPDLVSSYFKTVCTAWTFSER